MTCTKPKIGWCFVGTGCIAHAVRKDCPDLKITNVVSRTAENARAFADSCGAAAFTDFDAGVSAPDTDAVYIATTNEKHFPMVLRALELGKPVLCEKPLALNAREAAAMRDAAAERGLLLTEAMWTNFNPVSHRVREWIRSGAIGDVHFIQAQFCAHVPYDPQLRHYNMAAGGGSILDIGVYPLAYTQFLFGSGKKPRLAAAASRLCPTGADNFNAFTLQYEGVTANIISSMSTAAPSYALIGGSKGYIEAPDFWMARRAVLHADGRTEPYERTEGSTGYPFEFAAFEEALRTGKTECNDAPLGDTVLQHEIMDAVRAEAGVRFPGEETVL